MTNHNFTSKRLEHMFAKRLHEVNRKLGSYLKRHPNARFETFESDDGEKIFDASKFIVEFKYKDILQEDEMYARCKEITVDFIKKHPEVLELPEDYNDN